MDSHTLSGQLVIGGFDGVRLPVRAARALESGALGGVVLFRRNVPPNLADLARLNRDIAAAARKDLPPLIAVDQEGGRVARIGAPALVVPPMLEVARRSRSAGEELVRRVARAHAVELRALGFTMNLAPVLDVHSNPANPVIGDRAFGETPEDAARLAVTYARELQDRGLLACGKHFPGHGDTSEDSHLALPTVRHARERIDRVELAPFRAAIRAGIAAIMTAHVIFDALDPGAPATLSTAIATKLLRDELGFEGVLICDDLEMKAIADRWGVEDAAVRAVRAGCDALLVCSNEDLQARAQAALAETAEKDAAFRARCLEAAERVIAMRRRVPPAPIVDERELFARVGGDESRAAAEALR